MTSPTSRTRWCARPPCRRAVGRSASLLLSLLLTLVLGPAGPTASAPAPSLVTAGRWPLDPRPPVVRAFVPPDGPYGRGHRGVDLRGRAGQPVRTALPGRVSFSGRLAGRGVVVVDHGSTRTTYEPVTGTTPVGTAVAAGGVLGRLETGGSHCAPAACLHWGWRRGDTYLDPLRLVRAPRVRLLPIRPGGGPG